MTTSSTPDEQREIDQYGQPVCRFCGKTTNAAYAGHNILICWNCGGGFPPLSPTITIPAPKPTAPQPVDVKDDYVAWCRYNGRTIITCDSDAENAFKVYRNGDSETMAKFEQMSDCLNDIRVMIEGPKFFSRFNLIEAIRGRINFSLPDTHTDLLKMELDLLRTRLARLEQLEGLAAELDRDLTDANECMRRDDELRIVDDSQKKFAAWQEAGKR